MSKIIIHNESSARDSEALIMVLRVMSTSLASIDNQYCWDCHFENVMEKKEFTVTTIKPRGRTHTFKVMDKE